MLCKFWLTDSLVIYPENVDDETENADGENPIEILKPKIYKCDIKCLRLKNSVISLNEFIFLASKCEELWFDKSAVKNDGLNVELAELVEIPVNLKNFMYLSPSNFSRTVKRFQNTPNVKLVTFVDDFGSFC
uniref:Uncharacterized protein n=1 Tax=Panagrolaimus sp. PS1159 TaxID=55785 RepID=A0AC35EU95_9BILA